VGRSGITSRSLCSWGRGALTGDVERFAKIWPRLETVLEKGKRSDEALVWVRSPKLR